MGKHKYNQPPEIKAPVYPVEETVIRGDFSPRPKIIGYILDKTVFRKSKEQAATVTNLAEFRADRNRGTRSKRADLVGEWMGAMALAETEERSHWLKRVQDKIREIYHPTEPPGQR